MRRIGIRFILAFVSVMFILFNRESNTTFYFIMHKEYALNGFAQDLMGYVCVGIYMAFLSVILLEYVINNKYQKIFNRAKIVVFMLFLIMTCLHVYILLKNANESSQSYNNTAIFLALLYRMFIPLVIVSVVGFIKNRVVRYTSIVLCFLSIFPAIFGIHEVWLSGNCFTWTICFGNILCLSFRS